MASDKKTKLSIVIAAVDKATAPIRAVAERIRTLTGPLSRVGETMRGAMGGVLSVVSRVGSAIGGVLSKIPLIGGVIVGTVGAGVALMVKFIDQFDELGDKAEAIGVSADYLAQMRFAAKKSGASVEALDAGLGNFTKSLGQARAGTGRMASFLGRVSPALLKQLKATKNSEEAFGLLAGAMAKIEDPAKRAALASATLGDAELGPMFQKGPEALAKLRDRYAGLAGPQAGAVAAAGEFGDAVDDLGAAADGAKAALVQGLAPGLAEVAKRATGWLAEHREDIAKWAADLGKRLPGLISSAVTTIKSVLAGVLDVIDKIGKGIGWIVDKVEAMFAKLKAAKDWLTGDDDKEQKELLQAEAAQRTAFLTGSGSAEADDRVAKARKAFDESRLGSVVSRMISDRAAPGAMSRPDLSIPAARAADAVGATRTPEPQKAKIEIEIGGAPRGTRATTDPTSSADVDLTLGMNLYPGGI